MPADLIVKDEGDFVALFPKTDLGWKVVEDGKARGVLAEGDPMPDGRRNVFGPEMERASSWLVFLAVEHGAELHLI